MKAIALVIQRPARPAPLDRVDIEKRVVIKTETAPKASKLRSNHRLVIQKLYHILKDMYERNNDGTEYELNLRSNINLAMQAIKKASLCRERTDRNNTL